MDIKETEKYYERISDAELIRIATTDAHGLRPEVFGIIENELKKRNLDPDILKGALAQNREYSLDEIESYAKLLRDLPCPICGSDEKRLNGTTSHVVKSFLFFTTYGAEPAIACPDCLDKKNDSAILSTALLGWWGVPWGLLKTPLYIYRNIKAKGQNRQENSSESLLSYTLANIGYIETYKENKQKLGEIIRPRLR